MGTPVEEMTLEELVVAEADNQRTREALALVARRSKPDRYRELQQEIAGLRLEWAAIKGRIQRLQQEAA